MIKSSRLTALILLIVAVIALDAGTKYWVDSSLPLMGKIDTTHYPYGGISLMERWYGIDFALVHATNKGAAYGLFARFQFPLLCLRIGLIIALSLYLVAKKRALYWDIPLALILAGAMGNVIDTFIYGHVVDMLQFIFWGYPFAVFNIADSAITIGISWLMIASFAINEEPACPPA